MYSELVIGIPNNKYVVNWLYHNITPTIEHIFKNLIIQMNKKHRAPLHILFLIFAYYSV